MNNRYDEADVVSNEQRREIEQKLKNILRIFYEYIKSADEHIEELSNDEIIELDKYFRHYMVRHSNKANPNASTDRAKVFALLLRDSCDSDNIKKILCYLESVEYGWHGDKYYLDNSCLSGFVYDPKGCCKRKNSIADVYTAREIMESFLCIFFEKDYGVISLLIFSYCLVALFSGKLDQDNYTAPFFLQIACDKNSVLYQLIQEIVEICNVNSGIFEKCSKGHLEYRRCGYARQTFNPTQSTGKDIEDLLSNNKDIPAVIVGYENERNYQALLREFSNITCKRKPLGNRDRLHFLPIFICPSIKSSFDNVLDFDLTDLEVSEEYLHLLRDNKQRLASWVLELVMQYKKYLFLDDKAADKKYPFAYGIDNYINYLSQKHPELTFSNTKNVGFLNFFFMGCLRVFRDSITYPLDEEPDYIEGSDDPRHQGVRENIMSLVTHSEKSLVNLHLRYYPAPKSVGINDKEATRLAKQIEKHYRALKVYVRVIPAVVKEDRYIFNVETLQDTKDTDISKNAETVQRRLRKYEYFRTDFTNITTIKLIVAERPLDDNSLIKILNHEDFRNSKMKIPYAIGYDDMGAMCIADIFEFPHLLLGGTTRSGKSTAMMSLLVSIAYKHCTGDVNVLIMDLLGKEQSDFDVFNNQPFLSSPVIKDVNAASKAILRLDKTMNTRKRDRNLPNMPYIVCVIDEFPRLFSDIDDKDESNMLKQAMTRLLSGGRHVKIHMVLAAQDPKKDQMICGVANLPAKIAFRCDHYQRSMTILGRVGAEKLLGKGQMIFDSDSGLDKRLQGSYISKKDMIPLLSEIKYEFKQINKFKFVIDEAELNQLAIVESNEVSPENGISTETLLYDEMLPSVIIWTLAQNRIQGKFKVGDNRAKRILSQMEGLYLIEKLHGNLGWAVIPTGIKDIPEEAMEFLEQHDYTSSDIETALDKRTAIQAQVGTQDNGITDSLHSGSF